MFSINLQWQNLRQNLRSCCCCSALVHVRTNIFFTLIHAKGSLRRSFYSRPHFAWQPIADIILRRSTSQHLLLQQTKTDGKDKGCSIQWFWRSAPSSVNYGRRGLCDGGKNGAITLNVSDYSWCSTLSCSSLQIYSSSEWKANLLSTVCHSLNKRDFRCNIFELTVRVFGTFGSEK